jgi:hypothetical protein
VLQLVASSGDTQSAPAPFTLVVNNLLTPAPSTIRFLPNIKNVVTSGSCSGCHRLPALGGVTPIVLVNMDRDGSGGLPDATDDLWFYTELRGRINFTDVVASPLLRKPSGHHHRDLSALANFDSTAASGQAARVNYDLFLNWILNGAPL